MDETQDEKHESYGMVHLGRIQGTTRLFGSSVKHQHYISITIRTAIKKRNLHMDWLYADEELIEVNLSQNQLTELLFSVGSDGVPCTIRARNVGGKIQDLNICKSFEQWELGFLRAKDPEEEIKAWEWILAEFEKDPLNRNLDAAAKKKTTNDCH